MARITEELLRKCAEHNECEIFSLEELSLHQRNIVKIEHLDKWCRDLKILLLHNNLISKIENLNRLKKLEYVNFTLNNITKIENLEGCESLKKLDFTVNFIGELTSIENLKENCFLEEIYLTGNPCTEYEGYREFVLATLPQLKRLDGENIKVSERITAMQKYNRVRSDILDQQKLYLKNIGKNEEKINYYVEDELSDEEELSATKSQDKNFWKQPTSHTPQSRFEIYKHMEKTRQKDDKEKKKPKRTRILFADDGRPLNINEPKLNFKFDDDEENNCYQLNLAVYRYLSTSLLEADVQPNYVRILVKEKLFQLHLPKEVKPDSSTSVRSQTTGHLLVTMPKVENILKPQHSVDNKIEKRTESKGNEKTKKSQTSEARPSLMESLCNIVNDSSIKPEKTETESSSGKIVKDIPEFLDNPEVPPLI